MNKCLYLVIILLALHNCCFAIEKDNVGSYGLLIRAMPAADSEKTSLILENDSPLNLGKETTMSFDLLIRNECLFGRVFRIITNQNENIDLTLTVSKVELIVNEQVYFIPQDIVIDQWMPVILTFSKTKNELYLNYDNQVITIPYNLSNVEWIKISFGTSTFKGFASTDIASVNLRDIRIFNDGQIKRYWKLKEHLQNSVLDSVANSPALAVNPHWIVDRCSTWEKIYSDTVPINTQIIFDEKNTFYIVTPDSKTIYLFETTENKTDSIKVGSGYMAANSPNTMFFDSVANKLLSYNLPESFTSDYSFQTNTWSSQKQPTQDPYTDNSAVYSPHEHAFYSFGGYGYYKYAHELIRMSFEDDSQEKTELTEIDPRFYAATAIVNDTLYIFGGRGSKTGRQELSPHNYYDFYSVDLTTKKIVKLWEVINVDEDFLPSRNMVYDRSKNCFYLFTTKGGGTLLQIKTGEKGFTQMSFPIKEDFDVNYSYINLYLSEIQQKFYALIYKKKVIVETNISIYSLPYPPSSINNLIQVETTKQNKFLNGRNSAIIVALILFGVIGFLFIKKTRRKRKQVKNLQSEYIASEWKETLDIQEKKPSDFMPSSVYFLGGFNVIDKNGNNITGLFTPTLKYLLILLILYTEKNGKGISGNQLIQLLWFDKNEEAAINNRNVYYSKLRSVFKNVGKIELINKHGYWSIAMDKTITCDYLEAMALLKVINENENNSKEVNRLLNFLLRGVLLPNIEIDWLDNFKSDFSNLAIDILLKLSKKENYSLDDNSRMQIADMILMHDPLNEEALSIKCSILFNSGKIGIANTVFNNFCKEYNSLLGVAYKSTLADVVIKP